MDFIEISPDPPLPAYLPIPADAKSLLPERRLDEIPGESVDLSGDGDGEIDCFGCENSCGSVGGLEPFDPKLATLYWPRWDRNAIDS